MQDDIWICLWKGGLYTSSSYYKLHFSEIAVPAPLIWIWKGKSMPKIKFFAWLLLVDRLNTRGMLRRRNKFLEVGYSCALCPYDLEESTLHFSLIVRLVSADGMQLESNGASKDLYMTVYSSREQFSRDLISWICS